MSYEIIQHYLTKNGCYKKTKKMTPTGIVVHSTGCNNKNVTRYVDLSDLGTVSSNHWNSGTISKCVHFIVGWSEKKNKVVIVQTLPLNYAPWGCGSGTKGSYNTDHVQFEICEDGLTDKAYFTEAMAAAQWLCRYIMDKCGITSTKKVVSHKEAHAAGYASNHGDPHTWLSNFGKDMAWFRENIPASSKTSTTSTTTSAAKATTTLISKLQTVTEKKDVSLKGKYTVNDSTGAELRYGAGSDKYASQGNLKKGTVVTCYGYYNLDSSGRKWLYVTYDNKTGFILKSLLTR